MMMKNLPASYLLATQQGDIDEVKICLALGVGINACNHWGKTAITLAGLYQQYACIQALTDAEADINKQDLTCLNSFLMGYLSGDLTLLQTILPAKPDLNYVARFNDVSLTPVYEKGYLSIVKELLTHTETNVSQTNHVSWTPPLEAIVFNGGGIRQQAIVQLLLEHDANPHLADKHGRTSLELARERGLGEIVQPLVAAGAQTGRLIINTPERWCVWTLTADADFLAQWGQGWVEQVFVKAVNIALLAHQQLLTPPREEYDNTPNSRRLALTHFNGLFRHGDKVQFDEQDITVGRRLHIEISRCRCWLSPTLRMIAVSFHLIAWQQWHGIIHQHLEENETLFNYRGDSPSYQALSKELHIRRRAVIQAINDKQNIVSTVVGIIGLGVGLVPSADDYLTDLALVLFVPGHPTEKYKEEFYLGL